jgi:hypothetical protein
VYFDLIGLPPTPEEVEAFVNDKSPDAYAKLIDKLLASPRYGERWARHWLDVARYAEDQAHTFAVRLKTSAWRYRDWVIDALNNDMPYDQFVRLQLAGDLLPESTGDRFKRLAGLGFLGLGAEYYKNSDAAQAIADELDDRIDTVTRGFLALTVSCARCHDHKFDPIPTRDYYSLAGIFNGSKLTDAALAPPDVVKRYDDAQAKVKAREAKVKDWLADKGRSLAEAEVPRVAQYLLATRDKKESNAKLDARYLRRWVKFLDPKAANRVPASLRDFLAAKPADAARRANDFQKQLAAAVAAKKPTKEQQELRKAILTGRNAPFKLDPGEVEKSLPKSDAKQLAALRTELEQLKKKLPPMYPVAHVLSGGGSTLHVFLRGNPAKQGDVAPKGFLQILHSASSGHPGKDYDRLDLANAIASKDNPLTARVIVNRVWAHHFGRGLVNTTSNFGKLGDKPTHPELLDWLTVRFVENGWSLKWLHREILRSAAYQQRDASNPANTETDADNVYLWRANRRRLEVEPWRDALLAVAGRLDTTMGGPTTNLRDPGNARRTVYAKISRHDLNSLLRLFDFPDANVTAATRTMTTVPQQQLFVLNSEFIVTQAKAFAARVQKATKDDAKRIELAYRLAYGRAPSADELRIGRAFLASPKTPADKLSKWEQYAQVLLAANEFMYVD